jgi:cytochrome b
MTAENTDKQARIWDLPVRLFYWSLAASFLFRVENEATALEVGRYEA